MALPTPDRWTLANVNEAHAPTDADRDLWKVNRAFYDGDHLQGFRQWIGPMPQPSDPGYQVAITELERGFVSRNAIAEVSERHASGVAGKEPHRTWGERQARPEGDTAPAVVAEAIQRAAEMMRTWRTREGVATTHAAAPENDQRARPVTLAALDGAVWEAVVTMLLCERACAYLYVPPGALEPVDPNDPSKGKRLPRGGEKAMLDLIRVRFPDPSQCGVYTDSDTLQQVGVYRYTIEVETESGGKEQQERADLCWVDKDGFTVLRQVGKPGTPGVGADGTVGKPVRYDFGGRLPIFEMRRPLFITEQVRQAQRAINLALSAIPLNVIAGGWLERVVRNAEMPGDWQYDKETGKKIPGTFEAQPLRFGPKRVTVLQGAVLRNDQNEPIGRATPEYDRGDPVPIDASEGAADAHFRTLLAEVDQLHTLITAANDSSGVAIQQARAGFAASLGRTARALVLFLVALEETPLAMAEGFVAGQGQKSAHPYTATLRPSVALKLDLGPVTPDERRAAKEMGDAGRWSDETVLAATGVDDIAAEMKRLEPQRQAKRRRELLADAAQIKNEFSMAAAVAYLREHGEGLFSDALLAAFARGDFTDNVEQ